jgi:hypothetical protein
MDPRIKRRFPYKVLEVIPEGVLRRPYLQQELNKQKSRGHVDVAQSLDYVS